MHHPQGQDQWVKSLQQHAARLAFPDWEPRSDDWTHLYTGFENGTRYTDVAVYHPSRDGGHERICYRRYAGDDLMAFWNQLVGEISQDRPM